jgi:hypothetical protein
MMNISWFHISCIPKTDNRRYFTVGGALDHLEQFKHTEQYVNTIRFSCIGICGLPVYEGRGCACVKLSSALQQKYLQMVLSEYAL